MYPLGGVTDWECHCCDACLCFCYRCLHHYVEERTLHYHQMVARDVRHQGSLHRKLCFIQCAVGVAWRVAHFAAVSFMHSYSVIA